MKRQIFFWLEKLKITPTERKVISGLMIVLVSLSGVNAVMSPSVPFSKHHYRELEKQFHKRTAMLRAKDNKLMKQYFPSSETNLTVAKMDSVPVDSSQHQAVSKQAKDTQEQRININSASLQALQTLPGIGPTYAKRIIKYRKQNGGFSELKELKKIKGIAQKRLDKLKPFVKLTDSK